MGIAIINQNADYSLERVAQNVIPTEAKYRKLLTSGTFSYGNVSALGICKLNMVDLQDSTLPYLYKICNSSGTVISNRTGVSINEISGVITLSTGYDGQDVYVKLEPQIVAGYYDSAISGLITKAINAGSWSGDTPTYSNLSVSTFTYTTVDSSGGSVSPTISYSYTKTTSSGSTTGSTEGTITYSFASNSHEGASINSTNGNVTFTANSSSERLYEVNARIVLPDGTNDIFTTNVRQTAALQLATLESISAVALNSEMVAGSTISASDFTVTGHYSDNSTKTLTTSIKVSPTEISYGTNNITVSYGSGIKTCTVTIQGYDKITAVSYNRPIELTSVPSITATLDNLYTGYNSYATSGNSPKLYNFELVPARMATSSQDYTFAKLSEVNTAKGNVVFDVANLPDGGVITDRNLSVTITNTSDSSDVMNSTIQSPLTSLVNSNGWNNDLTTLNRAGTSLTVISITSGPTAYEVITSYTADGSNPWDWYVCDVPENANYLIIETTALDNGVHSVILQANGDVVSNKILDVTSLIRCYLGGTNVYKINRNVTVNSNTKIYITHIHANSLEGLVSVKVKFLETLTAITPQAKLSISGLPDWNGKTGANSPYTQPDNLLTDLGNAGELPLFVEVTDGLAYQKVMTFALYKALSYNKETYSNPVVTFSLKSSWRSVNADGTLTFDFTLPNYVYDYPNIVISNITIGGTSNSITKEYPNANTNNKMLTIQGDRLSYRFIDKSSFTEITTGTSSTLALSDESTVSLIKIITSTSSNKRLYALEAANSYYILLDSADTTFAIISIATTATLDAGTIDVNGGDIKYVHPGSTNRHILIRHTPSPGTKTYILQTEAGTSLSNPPKYYVKTINN